MVSRFTSESYRPDVDGLRAVAIIAVLAFHAFPDLFPGGFVGVDIFFVISGYVITKSLMARPYRGYFGFVVDFLARRFRRLAPALLVYVIVAGLVVSLFDPGTQGALGLSLETGQYSQIGRAHV